MARSNYQADNFVGNGVPSTLSSDISNSATSFNVTPATNWPATNFWAVINRDTANEEKIYVETNSSGALSSVNRGQDDTTAVAASAGDPIELCAPAKSFDEANDAVVNTIGKIAAAEDILVGTAANTLKKLAKGSNNTLLGVSSGGALEYRTAVAADIADSAVTTAKINNAAVTPDKLGTGAATATVATSETTTSTSFTDLATSGPAVTVTIGANGLALVSLFAATSNGSATGGASMGFAVSGASTVAADDAFAVGQYGGGGAPANLNLRGGASFLVTGLTAGSNTFTSKYKAITTGTATFAARRITVVPL